MTDVLWSATTLGEIELANRLAMAPMTRDRSAPDGTPTDLNAEYYAQRASVGLIITEGTQPSDDGQGYLLTPGIYSDEHIEGWRGAVEAVHAAGATIVIQLMHVGRIAHPDNTPHGRPPLAPSAIAPSTKMFTASGEQEIPTPRALATGEVEQTVEEFRKAAAAAIEAGADGVEVHGANGYLVHQFLSSNANERTDRYGGSIENRIRFAVEVSSAIAEEIGAARTGIQISPGNDFNDMREDDTGELYRTLIDALAPLGLAYLNVAHQGDEELLGELREAWPTGLILNRGNAPIDERVQDLERDLADVISFGRPVLANPDFVARLRQGGPYNEPDPATFYGGAERGYIDYPTLDQ